MWWVGGIIFAILVRLFGISRAVSISGVLIGLICVVLVVGFFIGFVLPSQAWKNL